MTGKFIDEEILEKLVDNSIFFQEFPGHLHSLGQEIARMNFYSSSDVISGIHLGLERGKLDKSHPGVRYSKTDIDMILKGLGNVEKYLVDLSDKYANKTDVAKHPNSLSWFPYGNVELGEQIANENCLLVAYVLNSAGDDYKVQSLSDLDKGYLKLAQSGREIADTLHYVSKRLKTFEAFRL